MVLTGESLRWVVEVVEKAAVAAVAEAVVAVRSVMTEEVAVWMVVHQQLQRVRRAGCSGGVRRMRL